jgi:hypothetical protein
LSFYYLIQKIKFFFIAKNRHDIHSPFVYDFIDKVLNKKTLSSNRYSSFLGLNITFLNCQKELIFELIDYFQISTICFSEQKIHLQNHQEPISIWIFNDSIEFKPPKVKSDIVLILNIYQSKEKTINWNRLIKNSSIPLSVDLFEVGILFFKEDFIVKQHFKLKH